jgi:hypothetical protein
MPDVNGWLRSREDPSRKIQLCLRLAKWYAEDLGHPSTRSPTTSRSSQLDPNNVAVLRQMASFFKKGPVAAAGQTSRAPSTSRSRTWTARRSSPRSARCSRSKMNDVDQG